MADLSGACGSRTARPAPVLLMTDEPDGTPLSNHASCAGCGNARADGTAAGHLLAASCALPLEWQRVRAREAQSRMHARLQARSARVPVNIHII